MKKNNIKMLLSAVILLQALMLIAGTATAVKDSLDRAIIDNKSTETVLPRTGQQSNQSAGGYITEIDIYPVLNQTQNWQGFYGNVSGIISLKNQAGNEMFNWTMNMTDTHVYATTNSNFLNWTTLFDVNLTHLDYLWFGNKVMADTIEYTYRYNETGINRTFVNTSLSAKHVTTIAGFDDYVVQSEIDTLANKSDVLWAARVDAGKLNYKNQSSNYELLVPVDNNNSRYNATDISYYKEGDVFGDIYYFYMEIP